MELDIAAYSKYHHDRLMDQPARRFELTNNWKNSFPAEQGVYIVFQGNTIVYAGETGSIRGRMGDMRNTMNHCLRRTIGADLYKSEPGFAKATSKRAFVPAIEIMLNEFIKNELSVKVLPFYMGRKELEEYIFKHHKTKYNNKGLRITS